MRAVLAAMSAALMFGVAAEARAAGFCNCCGEGTKASCATVCEPVKPAAGLCVAAIDYAASSGISAGQNPLYDIPLRSMWLDKPDASQREALRRLLEKAREGVEADRRASLAEQVSGKIDAATVEARARLYDDAIVNYYLGMQAYRASGRGGDQLQ